MQIIHFPALDGTVVGYLHDDDAFMKAHRVRPAMVVVPGGGYNHLSAREADPIAMEYFAMGFNTFTLSYSLLDKAGNLHPLRELAETVAAVRRSSEAWHIDPEKIAVIGFSAGGHLAASLGILWNHPAAGLTPESRPNAMVLCYPVITMGEFAHAGSRSFVTGGREDLTALLSLENQVTAACPPTFLWHTVDDETVPVENSLLLASALRKNSIPFECHLFSHGPHGLSACTQEVESPSESCRPWMDLSKTWLTNLFEFTP